MKIISAIMELLTIQDSLLFLSILLSGMLAGLFYGYSCSVNSGLGNLSDREYLKAFQSINKSILNPYFFASFIGTLIILPLAAWNNYSNAQLTGFYLLLSATIIYTLGVFGVTVFGNVPLNEALAAFDIASASDTLVPQKRELFEKPWNTFHSIRTAASILAFALTIISLLIQKHSHPY